MKLRIPYHLLVFRIFLNFQYYFLFSAIIAKEVKCQEKLEWEW